MSARNWVYKEEEKSVLLANLLNTKEAKDSYHCINHNGFGRIRKFKRFSMHIETEYMERRRFYRLNEEGEWSTQYSSQVFQVGVCPLRCRFCFVDCENLNGTNKMAKYFQANEIIRMFLDTWPNIRNLDLSGGSPDLCPEFLYELLCEIEAAGLKGKITVWVESNLDVRYYSNISHDMIDYIVTFPNFYLLCSLKGWDAFSVEYNTRNTMSFEEQMRGIYFFNSKHIPFSLYIIFISNRPANQEEIKILFERLKNVDDQLPEKSIPLYIKSFSAQNATEDDYSTTYDLQKNASNYWDKLIVEDRKAALI